MTVAYVRGDIFSTSAQAIGVGLNALGQTETTPFFTALQDRYPVFISDFRRRGRGGALVPGQIWIWKDARPWLAGLVIQDTHAGMIRPRYIEKTFLELLKTWEQEGIHSLALPQLADGPEWPALREMIEHFFASSPLAVTVYQRSAS